MPAQPTKLSKVTPIAIFVLFLVCMAMLCTMFVRAYPAILALDLQAAFNSSGTQIALFSSATLLAYGLMQVPSGLITDTLGPHKTLVMFLGLGAVSTVAFALAPNFPVAVGARFLTGICAASVPAGGAILALYFAPDRYAMAMGFFLASSSLGNIMAAEPLARMSNAFGWSNALCICGAAILALGIIIFICINEKKAPYPLPPKKEGGSIKLIAGNLRTVMGNKYFWILTCWQLCGGAVFFSLMTMWVGPLLQEGYGLSKVDASRILLSQSFVVLVGVPLMTTLSDKLNNRKLVITMCSCLGFFGSLGLCLFSGQLGFTALVACICGMSIGSTAGCSLIFTLIRQNFPPAYTGTGIGGANMLWPLWSSALNVIFGVVLAVKKDSLGVTTEAIGAALSGNAEYAHMFDLAASAYTVPLAIYATLWGLGILVSIFLIKDRFEVVLR